MSRSHAPRPQPTSAPRPLPRGLIESKLSRGRLLLCLDYDGTIAELTNDPFKALPIDRAKNAIAELARHPQRIDVAIISGRDLDTLHHLLGLREGLLFAGTHGLEISGRDGVRHFAEGVDQCLRDLERLRRFIADSIPAGRGFIIEDKGVAITLNYRNADPAEAREAVTRFADFVAARTTSLQTLEGKMIREAVPRGIGGKGAALEYLMRDTVAEASRTVFVGDDVTDEDAFQVLAPVGGITVMVGRERKSFAKYRLEHPAMVADLLAELVSAVIRV